MATKKTTPKEKEIKKPELVKMVKGDLKADVHPLEVDNYKNGGYKLAE